MTKAKIREQIVEIDFDWPLILIGGAYSEFPREWVELSFLCLQPDEWDDREWNLILVHPTFGVFFGQSIDFDFEE